MNKQITSVFYGSDLLPYKDSARTIHYPLTAGTFAGSHNTKEVRFYVRDIGGTNGISWVVVSKLPNGKIGYEVCSNVQPDSELGEQYLSFDLSAYYTQVKGDLYLALRGYQGEIEFTNLDEQGNPLAGNVYRVAGDPLIEVTGTIKLSINYSPMVNTGTQVLPTDIDRIISALSNYLEIANGIIVTSNISGETPSDYNTNQIFFEYKNNLGTFYYVKETSGVKSFSEITFDGLRTEELRVSDYILLTNNARLYYDDNKFKVTVNGHTLALDTSGNLTLDNYAIRSFDYTIDYVENHFVDLTTNQEVDGNKTFLGDSAFCKPIHFNDEDNTTTYGMLYPSTIQPSRLYYTDVGENSHKIAYDTDIDSAIADFLQNEYSKVNTTTYPTLNSFLASTGQEGYIYLYPIDTSDESKGYYQYIWENSAWVSLGTTQIDLSGYVEKTQTIAGIDLQDNISASELTDALVYATNTDIDNLF